MKKILLIRSNHFSNRVIKEAKSFVKSGYDVNLFLWNRKGEDISKYHGNEYTVYEYVRLVPLGSFKHLFHWLFWWYSIIRHISENKYDLIHVCGADSFPPVILSKLLKKYIIVYDIFDFFGPSMPEKTPRVVRMLFTVVEKFLIQFADAVIIVDESRLSQLTGSKTSKLAIIYNCVSDELQNIGLDKKVNSSFVVFYGGLLSKTRGILQMLDAVKDLPDMKLLVAGFGEDENELIELFKAHNNVTYLGRVSHLEALRLTYMSDVIFAFYDPRIPNNRLASPNKLFEAMMCATPIIANKETTMANIVEGENCGVVIPYFDTNVLKDALMKLKDNPSLCTKLGENGRLAFEKKYNWEIMEKRLINLYDELLAQSKV